MAQGARVANGRLRSHPWARTMIGACCAGGHSEGHHPSRYHRVELQLVRSPRADRLASAGLAVLG